MHDISKIKMRGKNPGGQLPALIGEQQFLRLLQTNFFSMTLTALGSKQEVCMRKFFQDIFFSYCLTKC